MLLTAMKTQALADHLAENPIDDEYEPLKTYFPDEDINSIEEQIPVDDPIWILYFDGAVKKRSRNWGISYLTKRLSLSCHSVTSILFYQQHNKIRSLHHGFEYVNKIWMYMSS